MNETHPSLGFSVEPPQTLSVDLQLPTEEFHLGWRTALARPPKIKLDENFAQQFGKTGAKHKPATVSMRIGRSVIRTIGFAFPEAPLWRSPAKPTSPKTPTQNPVPGSTPAANFPRSATRIKPPGDIVKLEDRLYYVLQPPLESLLGGACLDFPFEPFPYQMDGIAFLYPRFSAILADEMGLGKTMQAISTIRLLLYAGEVRSVLLVCPKPLVSNWRREFSMWAPEIPLGVIEGDQARRAFQWSQGATPVKLANYELLMRDQEIICADGAHFDLVVLDEAQRIKNRFGATSQVVCSISRQRSWALTGTPVENSPDDLVGIFEFLAPGYLTSASGVRPGRHSRHAGSADTQARSLGRAAADFILRRTKEMVLSDMPPKLFRDALLELTPDQQESYQAAEDQGVLHLADMGQAITIQHVFELVLRLKQICNFDPATGASSKFERLRADLEEVAASGKKAIVFSQWVAALKQLRRRLDSWGALEYHGQIPSKQRDPVLQLFKEDPSCHVLLMSYGAGSVGLNLQFCEYVFLFDRWWNPAVEDQAINRAHRIGVAGPVTVTRMLSVNTIEERINEILEEKRELFATIFSEAGVPKSAGLTKEQIFGLFDLRTPQGPLKAA